MSEAPVLVLGMHRSGTSLVAGACAALLGDDIEPRAQSTNPHGQFERVDLRPHLDALLGLRLSTWQHPPPSSSPWPDNMISRRLAHTAITRLGSGSRVWKDPRLAVTLPVWMQHLPDARLIVVHRDPQEVAASLQRRDGTSLDEGRTLWACYVRSTLEAVDTREVFVARHDAMTADPDSFVRELGHWLGVHDEGRRWAGRAAIAASSPADVGTEVGTSDDRAQKLWDIVRDWNGPTIANAERLEIPATSWPNGRPPVLALGRTSLRSALHLLKRSAR